ncbi:MAG TPA: hypothetical protein VF100_12390 [Thermoanaerobaculia bacterium]
MKRLRVLVLGLVMSAGFAAGVLLPSAAEAARCDFRYIVCCDDGSACWECCFGSPCPNLCK